MFGLKKGEVAVKENEFGILVSHYIRQALQPRFGYLMEDVVNHLRDWWPKLEEYWQRQIMTSIEVAIMLDDPPRPSGPLEGKDLWEQFVKDYRPAHSAFTVDYRCDKCETGNVKLWRGVHGCSDDDGNELLCARCLAPGEKVSDKGKLLEPPFKDKSGRFIGKGSETDQVKGWLPAIPVGDTYWGYSSVPSQDAEWWINLPTYKKEP